MFVVPHRPPATRRPGPRARIVLIDPPIPAAAGVTGRGAFSDITYGYLAELEQRSDHELHLMASTPQPVMPLARAHFHHVPCSPVWLRNVATQALLYARYGRRARALGPHLLYSPDYYALAIAARFNRGAAALLTTPGCIAERRATYNPYDRSYTWALEWATRSLQARGAGVLATSGYMAQWWQRSGFPARDTFLVPLPTRTTAATGGKAAARAALGWPDAGLHLLMVAACRPEMRLDLGVQLLARLAEADLGRRLHLHVVGDGPERSSLEALTARLHLGGQVQFHGPQSSQLPSYYQAADLLLVPRRHNATPRAAQEALCAGTPLLANLNASLDGFSDPLNPWIWQLDFETQTPDAELVRALCRRTRADDGAAVAQAAQAVFGLEATGRAFVNAVSTVVGWTR